MGKPPALSAAPVPAGFVPARSSDVTADAPERDALAARERESGAFSDVGQVVRAPPDPAAGYHSLLTSGGTANAGMKDSPPPRRSNKRPLSRDRGPGAVN